MFASVTLAPHPIEASCFLLPAHFPPAEATPPSCHVPALPPCPPATADHYTGLNENWSRGPIYCSDTTARLVAHMLGVSPQFLTPLPLDTPTLIAGAPCLCVACMLPLACRWRAVCYI